MIAGRTFATICQIDEWSTVGLATNGCDQRYLSFERLRLSHTTAYDHHRKSAVVLQTNGFEMWVR